MRPLPRDTMLALIALIALALPASLRAQTALPAPALLACLILPERIADLGSPVIGVVESVAVDRGDFVKKGQVLATLRAEVERANSSVVRSRAEGVAELRGAVAGRDLAQQRADRARDLAAQNFVSAQAVEQAASELRVADEKVRLAREQLATSAREVSSAQAQVSQRVLRSPFDGVITERFVNPGERVDDKPLLKLAAVSQLRVEVVASNALFGSLHVGQDLSVQPELGGLPARTARITQIDHVLEPASNTFRLRLELPNADNSMPAGLRCKASMMAAAAPAAAPAPTRGVDPARREPTAALARPAAVALR